MIAYFLIIRYLKELDFLLLKDLLTTFKDALQELYSKVLLLIKVISLLILQALDDGRKYYFCSVINLYISSFDLQNEVRVFVSTLINPGPSSPYLFFWRNSGTGFLSIIDDCSKV